MMKEVIDIILTNEIINKIIKDNIKCTYVNEDYVILYKSMEVCDDLLPEYLARMKKAKANGINIATVIDYRLLEQKDIKTSKGIFLEERAKGNVLNIRGIILKETERYNFKKVIFEYLEKVQKYLIELEKRANASQEIYDKFLKDFISLYDFGLKPDPNSLNYLFDPENGFTIIDPYINNLNGLNEKKLFSFIINDIYGVSRPSILIKKEQIEGFYYLTENLKNKLEECSGKINKKICLAFKKQGYSMEYIISELERNKMRFFVEEEALEIDDLVTKLEEQFLNRKTKK